MVRSIPFLIYVVKMIENLVRLPKYIVTFIFYSFECLWHRTVLWDGIYDIYIVFVSFSN